MCITIVYVELEEWCFEQNRHRLQIGLNFQHRFDAVCNSLVVASERCLLRIDLKNSMRAELLWTSTDDQNLGRMRPYCPDAQSSTLSYPVSVSVDAVGLIYVLDCGNKRIFVFCPPGVSPSSTSRENDPQCFAENSPTTVAKLQKITVTRWVPGDDINYPCLRGGFWEDRRERMRARQEALAAKHHAQIVADRVECLGVANFSISHLREGHTRPSHQGHTSDEFRACSKCGVIFNPNPDVPSEHHHLPRCPFHVDRIEEKLQILREKNDTLLQRKKNTSRTVHQLV